MGPGMLVWLIQHTGRLFPVSFPACQGNVEAAQNPILYRGLASFVRANTRSLLDGQHKHLAVANLARFGRGNNGFAGRLHLVIANDDFQFDLRQEVHRVLATAIHFGVTLLATKPFDL
ncbi:uncharacterized protein METZ01_LOCUS514000, partial [marine metagenome]